MGAEAFHIPYRWGRGRGQDNRGALCWSSQLLGRWGDLRNPRPRMLGIFPLGGNQGSTCPSRVQGKQKGQLVPQAGGCPGNPYPGVLVLGRVWTGHLGSLAGSQGAGPVVGR